MNRNHPRARRAALIAGLLAASLALPGAAGAAIIVPTSYDMPNGHGRASGGTFNYWDRDYSGSGSVGVSGGPHTDDGELLTGGLGDLTDGVIPTQNWNAVENVDGTGPYVGWRFFDPTITFHFAGPVLIDTVTLHVDDSNNTGGVRAPASVDINGINYSLPDPASADPIAIMLVGLAEYGPSLTMTLHANGQWVFLSEVGFEGAQSLSEPHGALLGIGLLGVALLPRPRWRRRERAGCLAATLRASAASA